MISEFGCGRQGWMSQACGVENSGWGSRYHRPEESEDLVRGEVTSLKPNPGLSGRCGKWGAVVHPSVPGFCLEIKHDPRRRMVARVFLPTRPSVNTAVHQSDRQIR